MTGQNVRDTLVANSVANNGTRAAYAHRTIGDERCHGARGKSSCCHASTRVATTVIIHRACDLQTRDMNYTQYWK